MKKPAPIALVRKPVEPVDPWAVVMAGLTGQRLAIYDELLTRGSVGEATLAQFMRPRTKSEGLGGSLAWLAGHHFVRAEDGVWRAVAMATARAKFAAVGAIEVATLPLPERGGTQAAHMGVGLACDNSAARPDAFPRAVHANAFLDLGDV